MDSDDVAVGRLARPHDDDDDARDATDDGASSPVAAAPRHANRTMGRSLVAVVMIAVGSSASEGATNV